MLLSHELGLGNSINHWKVLHNLIINKFMKLQKFNNFKILMMICKKISQVLITEINFYHQTPLRLQLNKRL